MATISKNGVNHEIDTHSKEQCVIGISLGSFSTVIAGSTREGEIKIAVGPDGEHYLETRIDSQTELNKTENKINGTGTASTHTRLDQLISKYSDISKISSSDEDAQAIAKLFTKVKYSASSQIGGSIGVCVVSVPSNITKAGIDLIVKSAKIAGFKHVVPLKESIATVLVHDLCGDNVAIDQEDLSSKIVCTINVGCYNTEFSIVNVTRGSLKILASRRLPIGGSTITNSICEEIAKRFCIDNKMDISQLRKRALDKLYAACETSKKSISISGIGRVVCESLHEGIDCDIPLSLHKLEMLCSTIFKDSQNGLTKFLSDSGIDSDKITHVVLAGGAMKMQRLQSVYGDLFNGSKILLLPEPQQSVARGCCLHGCKLVSTRFFDYDLKINGTLMGVRVLNIPINLFLQSGEILEIFPAKSVVPTFRSIRVNLGPNQNFLHVVLGESYPLAEAMLNVSSLIGNSSSRTHLLIVIESENLIKLTVASDGSIVDSVDIDFNSVSPTPVSATA